MEAVMKEEFMREAIRLSRERMNTGKGGPFGAVVVKDNQIIARGNNQVTVCNDPTAHAEVVAIRSACESLQSFSLQGCELYSSCEPCPMCLSAVYWSRLDRLYFAGGRDDAAAAGFDDAFLYKEIHLAPMARTMPTVQMMREQAVVAFEEWKVLEDRIEY
jgi:tRNA(Arg) A34 adenosine deaminase TadA